MQQYYINVCVCLYIYIMYCIRMLCIYIYRAVGIDKAENQYNRTINGTVLLERTKEIL